jgi:hypothetical protein
VESGSCANPATTVCRSLAKPYTLARLTEALSAVMPGVKA